MQEGIVIEEHKTTYRIAMDGEEYTATVRGSFFDTNDFPKVGDIVICEDASDGKKVIESIKPRRSSIVRQAAHTGLPQTIVANVDTIFIVMGLDGDFNLSRLERYLLLASQSNIPAVVVLNKQDEVEDVSIYIDKVRAIAGETPVHAVSALTGEDMSELLQYFGQDKTVVLLGSSGAGKSTMTNWLLREDKQSVNTVRDDDSRGKHTTTSRQLFALPTGGFLIDTPGMRELAVVENATEENQRLFERVESFAEQCRFSNCDHDKSAGCAIVAAIKAGDLTERELRNYKKLQAEQLVEKSKQDIIALRERKQQQKKLHQKYKKENKSKELELE